MSTAFVTGATGFVGLNLVQELSAADWQVVALYRASSNTAELQLPGVQLARGDITDADSVLAAMPQSVDVVFHVAGDTSLWTPQNARQDAINVDGTRHVVQAALARRAGRLIHTSTLSAYGRPPGAVVVEDTPSVAPQSSVNYERSKWRAEQEVHQGIDKGLDALFMNPAVILGPGDTTSWAEVFFMLRDGRLAAMPPGSASFNHVAEVVKAHVVAAIRGASGEHYLLGGNRLRFAEMIRSMAAQMGIKPPRLTAPAGLVTVLGHLQDGLSRLTHKEPDMTPEKALLMSADLLCDSSKACRDLDYQFRTLEDCVRDSYQWLRTRKLI